MKIRIRGNSVRYRLTRPEVAILADKGTIEEKTQFPDGSIIYAIEQSKTDHLSADFFENKITLYAPQSLLEHWVNTDQIGIEYHMPLPNNDFLYLLLEKDFKCIDGSTNKDQSDFFENPHLKC